MPVIIKELVITMVVDANTQNNGAKNAESKNPTNEANQKEIIRNCVEQVLMILKEKNER